MPKSRFPGEYFKLIHIHAISKADAALRPLGLTTAQSDVLRFLELRGDEPATVQDISTHFGLRHPTVIGILHRLESKGFITTAPSAQDRRCRIVRTTTKAAEVSRVMEQMRDELDEQSARGFSDEELLLLRDFLARVYQNVSGC
ncbi:MarR family winged helix-turn-helix transcriptional regulator [Butyricicoccus sp. Marseille-Q5471]|uniref:MarR family winged helix-turn-helix transcriptional regulator n=1 Tax=Butyricicoccus sp. Marseille-Q5471 TaxID=3039493 RepID=UPI0024BC9F76|nr:MarR family transcriptional regulator [Butyricicoccus sp. Marseille-Q5471]